MNRSVLAVIAFAALAMPSAAAEFNGKTDLDKVAGVHSVGAIDRVLLGKVGNYTTEKALSSSSARKDFVVAVREDCVAGVATDFVEKVITCADEAQWVDPAEYGPYVRTAE